MRKEVNIKAYKMTVKDFLKEILDKTITEDTQIRYRGSYYTFYIESFKFIKNSSGTGLVINKVLDDKMEVFIDD